MPVLTYQYHTYIKFCFLKKIKIKFVFIIFCSLLSLMKTSKKMIFEIAYFIKSVSKMEIDDCVNHAKKICEELTCMGDLE
ncbi:MAG: hypothetical protein LPJ98_03290, partial [Cyclobacteriaceae bacterium]|nr:hypothetical protein [Cyclobacteriaceae bacterium]